MTRKCPYCGEPVPSYSINCPRCYRSIPRGEESKKKEEYRVPDDRAPSVFTVNRKIVILLALIPAAFGLMGLGQFYEREYRKGLTFLIPGLLMFIMIVTLLTNFSSYGAAAFLAVGGVIFLLILYIVLYVIQAFDAAVRSLFPVRIRTQ